MDKKKYLFVTPYYVPAYAYGGPVKGVHARAKRLAARGHSVTVLTSDVLDSESRYRGPRETVLDGVNVHYFTVFSNRLAYYANHYRVFGLKTYLRQHVDRYDFVFLHDFFTYTTRVGARECHRRGVPYAVTPHGVLNPKRLRYKYWLKRMFLARNRYVFDNCRFAVALTQTERRVLTEYLPDDRIELLPNGIEHASYSVLDSLRGGLRDRLGLGGEPLVVFVGRINHIKGLDILTQAFRQVAERRRDARLVIVGPDEGYGATLERNIRAEGVWDRVSFTGLLTGDELLSAYADADVFAFCSHDEGLPNTVLEASAAGVPCVISEHCNVPEVAELGAGHVLPNEPHAVAEHILTLLNDPDGRAVMGRCGKRMVRERFAWDAIIDKLERLSTAGG